MSKRPADQDALDVALKHGERPAVAGQDAEAGHFEDDYEDEFEDEIMVAGEDGLPDDEGETEANGGMHPTACATQTETLH